MAQVDEDKVKLPLKDLSPRSLSPRSLRVLNAEGEEDVMRVGNVRMSENIYGLAVVSLVRDLNFITKSEGHSQLRFARLVVSQSLVFLIIFLQSYLLFQAKLHVTATHVDRVRHIYSEYEYHMYHGQIANHTVRTVNGGHRGIAEYFDPEAFETLPDDLKQEVCSIAMSHPQFFMIILLIWTLTCIGELKQCYENIVCTVLCNTPTMPSMKNALASKDYYPLDEESLRDLKVLLPDVSFRISELEVNERLVVGVTRSFKVYASIFLIVPRVVITVFLLWLGSRWLMATIGFENTLLNAVALEFILLLKELLYATVVPARNRLDVTHTVFLPHESLEKPKAKGFLALFLLFFAAVVWIYLYVHVFQTVLPGYRWDVRAACTAWSTVLDERFR